MRFLGCLGWNSGCQRVNPNKSHTCLCALYLLNCWTEFNKVCMHDGELVTILHAG